MQPKYIINQLLPHNIPLYINTMLLRTHYWSHVISCDLMWSHVISCDLMWSCDLVISCGLMWSHVISCDLMWSHVIQHTLYLALSSASRLLICVSSCNVTSVDIWREKKERKERKEDESNEEGSGRAHKRVRGRKEMGGGKGEWRRDQLFTNSFL